MVVPCKQFAGLDVPCLPLIKLVGKQSGGMCKSIFARTPIKPVHGGLGCGRPGHRNTREMDSPSPSLDNEVEIKE